jgi:WD40 repeat protein
MALILVQIFFLLSLCSCVFNDETPIESFSNEVNLVQSGDIVVANSGNDSIILLNSDGSYKSTLVNTQTSNTLIYNGLAWDPINKVILFNNDSSVTGFDAINSISLFDGGVDPVVSNNQLNGVLRGVARLEGGELIVLEGNTSAEKFSANGTRIGSPFLTGLTSATSDVTKLSTGGFIICSTSTSNTVRIYDADGVVLATATSTSPAPSLGGMQAKSCTEDQQGRIIVAYSGGTDAVRMYDASLSTVIWTYTNTTVFSNPGKLAMKANGNILVTDLTFHHIIELDPNGAQVDILGGVALSTPSDIVVVP